MITVLEGSLGSSVYNAYGGFLENNKTINKYKFVNGLNDPPPIKQYWSWGGINPLIKQDINANINKKQEINLLNIKIDADFDENLYQKEHPETKDFYQPYCSIHNIDDKRRLFYHYSFYGNTNQKS